LLPGSHGGEPVFRSPFFLGVAGGHNNTLLKDWVTLHLQADLSGRAWHDGQHSEGGRRADTGRRRGQRTDGQTSPAYNLAPTKKPFKTSTPRQQRSRLSAFSTMTHRFFRFTTAPLPT